MATKQSTKLNTDNVQAALIVIQKLYGDYTPDEITEAFKINRQSIVANQEKQAIESQIAELSKSLDNLS